jgi:hypothetical protein
MKQAPAQEEKAMVRYVSGNEQDAYFLSESLRILSRRHAHERRGFVKVLGRNEMEELVT